MSKNESEHKFDAMIAYARDLGYDVCWDTRAHDGPMPVFMNNLASIHVSTRSVQVFPRGGNTVAYVRHESEDNSVWFILRWELAKHQMLRPEIITEVEFPKNPPIGWLSRLFARSK